MKAWRSQADSVKHMFQKKEEEEDRYMATMFLAWEAWEELEKIVSTFEPWDVQEQEVRLEIEKQEQEAEDSKIEQEASVATRSWLQEAPSTPVSRPKAGGRRSPGSRSK